MISDDIQLHFPLPYLQINPILSPPQLLLVVMFMMMMVMVLMLMVVIMGAMGIVVILV